MLLHNEIAHRLLDRLEFVQPQGQNILLYGFEAESIHLRLHSFHVTHLPAISADAKSIYQDLNSASFDCVILNLCSPEALLGSLSEIYRILKNRGCFLFSVLHLEQYLEVIEYLKKNISLLNLKNLGNHLLALGWSNPVLDIDSVAITYPSQRDLLNECLKFSCFHSQEQPKIWALRSILRKYTHSINFEIIYGIGWKILQHKTSTTEFSIPIESIHHR